jgi:uncharacterized membrane protein
MLDINEIKQMSLVGFILVSIDIFFLNYFMKDHFSELIKRVQHSDLKLNYSGAIFTYILLCLGLYYFIIREGRSIRDAFLLGVFTYGIYEGTSYSLLNKWTIKTILMDTLWGGVLFALTTFLFKNIKIMFNR